MLLVVGAAAVLWSVFAAKSINRSGGWGWLLVGGIYLVAIIVVCFACALCTTISLFRREPHRRLSIAILTISCLVVSAFGPNLIRAVIGLHRQHFEVARASKGSLQPSADTLPQSSVPTDPDKGPSAPATHEVENPQILELKSKLWEAIRTKNADAFVDCFYIEERFNTAEIRQENRNQVASLLRGERIDVEIMEIPAKELSEIMKIQKATPNSPFRYSLNPRILLRIWHEAQNGRVGRSFLLGEKNGKWYIITMAGHTT